MRTTLVLDDEVVRAARHRAVDAGLSLSEFVNRALSAALSQADPVVQPRFSFPEYGAGPTTDQSPAALWAAMEEQDLQSLARG